MDGGRTTALLFGCLEIWAGVRAFAGQSVPWSVVLGGPLVVVVACTDLSLPAIDALRAERAERLVMRRVLAVLGGVTTFPVIWRAINAQVSGAGFALMGNTASTALPLVVLFITAVAITVCLLLIGRERLGNELVRAAATDGLTGTLNRAVFLAQARQAAELCGRSARPCSVVVMDLDEFKAVDDRHGHAAGDVLLAGFANIADRLRRAFSGASFDHRGGSIAGTVSIGVAQAGDDEDVEQVIQRADMAMYNAKKGGRDRVNRATG